MLAYGQVDRERVEWWLTQIVGHEDRRLQRWAARCVVAESTVEPNPDRVDQVNPIDSRPGVLDGGG